jgi:hypothetical protein
MSSAPVQPLARLPDDVRRTIPFDYRFRFELLPRPNRPDESLVDKVFTTNVEVSIEAAFVAVSIGYGLVPLVETIAFGPGGLTDIDTIRPSSGQAVALRFAGAQGPAARALQLILGQRRDVSAEEGDLYDGATTAAGRERALAGLTVAERAFLDEILSAVPPRRHFVGDIFNSLGRSLGEVEAVARGDIGPRTAIALQQGIRLRPDALRMLLLSDGHDPLAAGSMEELFETVEAPPERVQFLYALFDEGTGRAFQNEPVLNIAGLGSSDGDRPFRHFMPPIRFAPRTTIRMELTPKTEFKGEMHVVLHGYKILGGSGTPTGRALQRGQRRRRRR